MIRDTIIALSNLDLVELDFVIQSIRRCRTEGGTVFLAGNGGSYTTALHWALDLCTSCAVRTYVLGGNAGLLTALSNDLSYEEGLSFELGRLAKYEDRVIALSCSGSSKNIVQLLSKSREKCRESILITSRLCNDGRIADQVVRVKSTDYGVIEDVHLSILHHLVEELRK